MKSEDTIRQLDDNTALTRPESFDSTAPRDNDSGTAWRSGEHGRSTQSHGVVHRNVWSETHGQRDKGLGEQWVCRSGPGAALGLMMDDPAVNDCARTDLDIFLTTRSARSNWPCLAIILGGLIGWLQTKVEIQVSRKNRETEFHFSQEE